MDDLRRQQQQQQQARRAQQQQRQLGHQQQQQRKPAAAGVSLQQQQQPANAIPIPVHAIGTERGEVMSIAESQHCRDDYYTKPGIVVRGLPEPPPTLHVTQDALPEPSDTKGFQGQESRPPPAGYPQVSSLCGSAPRIRPDGAGMLAWDCPHEGRVPLRDYARCQKDNLGVQYLVRSQERSIAGRLEGIPKADSTQPQYCLTAKREEMRTPRLDST